MIKLSKESIPYYSFYYVIGRVLQEDQQSFLHGFHSEESLRQDS